MRISDWSSDVCSSDLAEFRNRSQDFIDALDVDDVIAHLLVTEGFTSVDQVAYVPIEDLAEIEGFDEEVAGELQARARGFLEAENERLTTQRRELGVEDRLAEEIGRASCRERVCQYV